MRLSEKTLELTFCHQFGSVVSPNLVWFGLTQRQEAIAGFDACAQVHGRLLIFQFKASSYTLSNGMRRFYAPHHQMVALRDRYTTYRGIYYVFPLVGTTQEIAATPAILPHTWLLDVADLPDPIPAALKRDGTPRHNEMHYIDVEPFRAVIYSEPFNVPLIEAKKIGYLIEDAQAREIGIPVKDKQEFWDLRESVKRNAIAVILRS
jgi:hypothetical protein